MNRQGCISGRLLKTVGCLAAYLPLVFGLVQVPKILGQSRADDKAAKLPTFEVVSIKPYPSSYWPTAGYPPRFTADKFIWKNTIAQDLLVYAYDLRDPKLSNRQRLIPGGEKWMFWEWFDVEATMSDESISALNKLRPSDQKIYKRQLLQSMLMDRFKLKVHHVTRGAPAWELVVAKNGPKNMERVPDSTDGVPAFPDFNHAQYTAAPVARLIEFLEGLEDVPVLDKTGLTGRYNFKIAFSRDPDTRLLPGQSLPSTNDSEPTIGDALQEQLGLKLVRVKIPLDEIVIDHIEKPSPN
jgi:bla regulator protein blaR1